MIWSYSLSIPTYCAAVIASDQLLVLEVPLVTVQTILSVRVGLGVHRLGLPLLASSLGHRSGTPGHCSPLARPPSLLIHTESWTGHATALGCALGKIMVRGVKDFTSTLVREKF